ncbi:MAG: 50S ribosomal protein L15 [bacterium]|nr:50S ribosomal protein L15 [bacterium]
MAEEKAKIGLHNFPSSSYDRGGRFDRKRLGRGSGSGRGGTAGRGHKGQKARSGGFHKVGFEGGQMPLARRVPKKGFTNIFKRTYAIVNLGDLTDLPAGTIVDSTFLKDQRFIRRNAKFVKVLGVGDLKTKLTVKADHFSASAEKKILAAGGQVERIHG